MPSMLHEGLVELFRSDQALAPTLLSSVFHVDIPPYTQVRTEDAQLTQIVPTEYRADLVLVLHSNHKPVFAIVVEVQLSIAERKPYSWPLYLTALRARFECPVALLVVTPDEDVANWATPPISLGPGSMVQPIVLGSESVPRIVDPTVARAGPHLAILSALAHGDEKGGRTVIQAALIGLNHLRDEDQTMYYDLMYISLGETIREELNAMRTNGYEYQSDFAKKYFAEGEARGKAEGEARGKAEGEARGKAKGKAEALLQFLALRNLTPTDAQREQILMCQDLEHLDRWMQRALTVASFTDLLES